MIISGGVQRFGDHVNTDSIIAAQHKAASLDLDELAKHVFEDLDPTFVHRVQPGDIVVAGRNFGCGSSREAAVHVLLRSGIRAVVASSFARIFFRNGINNGLALVECETSGIEQGDVIELDLDKGFVTVPERNITQCVAPLPPIMQAVLQAGGIARYLAMHHDLVLPAHDGSV